ncbi:class B sortase [Thermophilibacter mediterraneus]|uniref:class B sortase n=1 Tax=Thermophilibacter mediterraneus TaxID=1871031 RepID=UPI002357CCB0|nr:class B sortase [Thermophilibacter mediterraneus]
MRLARALTAFLSVVGLSTAALGVAAVARDGVAAASYRELAREVAAVDDRAGPSRSADDRDPQAGVDWGALLAQNDEVCAWLRVDGTTVDVPVVAAEGDDPDAWLYTDLWGSPSETGVPYLDHRCDPEGRLMVVYGHRTAYESYLFHDVSPLYEQGSLDAVGDATWQTPVSGTLTLAPLCAASVAMDDGRWQRFTAADEKDLRAWLSWALEEADATRSDAAACAGSAERALVLVTCNGRAYHPETRTVAVFVAPGAGVDGDS